MKDLIDSIICSLLRDAVCLVSDSVDLESLSSSLSNIAQKNLTMSAPDYLGEPNILTPKNWLSHGRESYNLPLHTDYPDYKTPPRFVLMSCESVGKFPVETIFYNIGDIALKHPSREVLLNEPWLTTGGIERARTVRLLEVDTASGAPRLRYATNVMRPFFRSSSKGQKILNDITGKTDPFSVTLTPGKTVIWDNWKVLHSRRLSENIPEEWNPGMGRILKRLKWI